jgi:hypothetical protein
MLNEEVEVVTAAESPRPTVIALALEEQYAQEPPLDAFSGVVAHGLLNSMAVVMGALTTLTNHWDRLGEDTRREFLDNGIEQAQLVTGTLRDLVMGLPLGATRLLEELDLESTERRQAGGS